MANTSTPDDMVFLYFSGHGYRDPAGTFYMLPSDSSPTGPNPSAAEVQRFISTDESSSWLGDVDAKEIVFVIDSCQSGASIAQPEFRPAPLGDRGLGQLAYDKRMRVLAASQPGQAAAEAAGKICGGVLTYALTHDGMRAGQAKQVDGTMSLRALLSYPIKRVPVLLQELSAGQVDDYGIPNATCSAGEVPKGDAGGGLQRPMLFDFGEGDGPRWGP